MDDRITIDLHEGVADVRLMRADKMNALDDAMFGALVATGDKLKTQRGVRAVVLSGEGRAFCAGLDTRNFGQMASGTHRVNLETITGSNTAPARTPGGANRAQQAVLVWREIPVPVIAAVHGVAFGGGFQLSLGADLRFVAPDAQLSVMEIKWGLVPDMAGMLLMRGLVRDDVARELIFSGRIFSGQEAFGFGLATRVCDDPRGEALAFAKEGGRQEPRRDPRGQAAPRTGCRGPSAGDTAGRNHRTGEADWITQSGRGGVGEFGEARAPVRRLTRRLADMCGRVIQSSGTLCYCIVAGMDMRDSRVHNYLNSQKLSAWLSRSCERATHSLRKINLKV
jgi:enoyl-CoA hydratase/carnithine racemase